MEQRVQHLLAASGSNTSRLEVLEGPTGRRSWPDEVKAAIVAESFEPGVKVSAVARRHGLTPQHLTSWRRAARKGRLVLPSEADGAFASILVEEAQAARVGPGETISIETGGIVVRVPLEISAPRLGDIVRTLRLT